MRIAGINCGPVVFTNVNGSLTTAQAFRQRQVRISQLSGSMTNRMFQSCSRAGFCFAFLAFVAFVTVPHAVHAQRTVPDASVVSGTLSFDGHSTVGDFVGRTTAVTGKSTGGALTMVHGWVEAPVDSLRTDNDHRDRDMRSAMESGKYPVIRFDLARVSDVAPAQGDSLQATLNGTLVIHGVTKEVALPATLVFSGDSVRVTSTFPLNLNDYQVKHLSKMLGMLKMHPDIQVHVNLAFDRAAPGVSAKGP